MSQPSHCKLRPPQKRGLILRILYRVYTNYLGVTPPTPAQERIAAIAFIGGVILGLGRLWRLCC